MRVGLGFDVHPLIPGEKLILGGVFIDYHLGLKGYSDADVLTHAIMDALLGSQSLGDIGQHFPPGEIEWKDIESLSLLERVKSMLDKEKIQILNIDTVLIAQRPELSPYIPLMKKNLSQVLHLNEGQMGIKATTTEGLGFCGRGEGIAAKAIVLVKKREDEGNVCS